MDISVLIAAIASPRGGASGGTREAEHEAPAGDLDQILAALEGKGKGKMEDRE